MSITSSSMSSWSRALLVAAAVTVTAAAVAAQRGRGPSEAIRSRSGAYFATATLPAPDADAKDRIPLDRTGFVARAAELGQLSLLYLVDLGGDEASRKQFERTMFSDPEIAAGLRCFVCARVDLAQDAAAAAEFGRSAPLFVAFDGTGRVVDVESFAGDKARPSALVKLLEKAARKHGELPLNKFVKGYRDALRDLTVLEGREQTLADKRKRLEKKGLKPADAKALADDEAELEADRDAVLAVERKLLEAAAVPPRPDGAVRLGDREWGRDRGGDRGGRNGGGGRGNGNGSGNGNGGR